jgi:hypothetical protein
MSHFYGTIEGRVRNSYRCGSKAYGLATVLYTQEGAIRVQVNYDQTAGKDRFKVLFVPKGIRASEPIVLSEGFINDIFRITGAQA